MKCRGFRLDFCFWFPFPIFYFLFSQLKIPKHFSWKNTFVLSSLSRTAQAFTAAWKVTGRPRTRLTKKNYQVWKKLPSTRLINQKNYQVWKKLPQNMQDNTPPRTIFEAGFLNNGESVPNTTRAVRLWGNLLDEIFPKPPFSLCVPLIPPCFRRNRVWKSSQGACYLITLLRGAIVKKTYGTLKNLPGRYIFTYLY